MSEGQVKNTVQGYISLNVQCYFATGQEKIKVYLSLGQVSISRYFTPDLGYDGCIVVVKQNSNCIVIKIKFFTLDSNKLKIRLQTIYYKYNVPVPTNAF